MLAVVIIDDRTARRIYQLEPPIARRRVNRVYETLYIIFVISTTLPSPIETGRRTERGLIVVCTFGNNDILVDDDIAARQNAGNHISVLPQRKHIHVAICS